MTRCRRPLVGLNADYVVPGKQTTAHARLSAAYFDAILAAGGLPVVIPPLCEEEAEAFLDQIAGVLLTGGKDMNPQDRLRTHPATEPMAMRRDSSDRILIRSIIDRQAPVLGIGLGMQLLNAACGGTCYAHLSYDQPQGLSHRDYGGGPQRHSILIEPQTRLERIYGRSEIQVNSAHHQAVRQVGAGLRIGAVATDGIIEAIEAIDPSWFCVGVQWHPEADTASALDRQLFDYFIQACVPQNRGQALRQAA